MKSGLQFGKWLAALGVCVVLALPGLAQQRPHGGGGQNRPPKPEARPQQRPTQREEQRNANRPPQTNRPESRRSNPNPRSGEAGSSSPNRPPNAGERSNNPNRPPNASTQASRRDFNNLNPQEKQRALNNYKDYEKRTPAEKRQIQESKKNWDGLSDDQRNHIKNDIAPKYQQLPQDRQRAIRSRLNVLKNMPESARNQHLNDPNFTRGMNEDDKAMLRDLAHMHVGGAPEAPLNE